MAVRAGYIAVYRRAEHVRHYIIRTSRAFLRNPSHFRVLVAQQAAFIIFEGVAGGAAEQGAARQYETSQPPDFGKIEHMDHLLVFLPYSESLGQGIE